MKNAEHLATFNRNRVITTHTPVPDTANKILRRLADRRHIGFMPSVEVNAQRDVLRFLEQLGAIICTGIYPNGYQYGVRASEVKWSPPPFYPEPGKYLGWVRRITKYLIDNPGAIVNIGSLGNNRARNMSEWNWERYRAIDHRINLKAGISQCGRRDNEDHRFALQRDKDKIYFHNNYRVIIRSFETAECRKRFAHLITKDD